MHKVAELIRGIAVADDSIENRQAAITAIAERLPGVVVHQFSSAAEIIAALDDPRSEINLVLSDMNMEDEDAGYRVACAAWSWGIPATVITAGITQHDHREAKGVFLLCPRVTFLGNKSDPLIWEHVIEAVLVDGSILAALRVNSIVGRNTQPNLEYGKICAAALCI